MGEKKSVSLLVVGGEVNAGPPLGPALGPLGVNVLSIVKAINDATKEYSGMRVPVKIDIDSETKNFELNIGIPTTSALIVKESGIDKGSSNPGKDFKGNLSMAQIIKIAMTKKQQSYAISIKSATKEILGSCISMGINIEGKDPRIMIKEIEDGKWNDLFIDN
jgi:large subunit ribosomal protein L11